TVSGAGSYAFLLTVIDGAAPGGHGPDKFRIKIWDKGTGAVIYDNQPGDADDAVPNTPLGGGGIVIHTNGNGPVLAFAAGSGPMQPMASPLWQCVWHALSTDAKGVSRDLPTPFDDSGRATHHGVWQAVSMDAIGVSDVPGNACSVDTDALLRALFGGARACRADS